MQLIFTINIYLPSWLLKVLKTALAHFTHVCRCDMRKMAAHFQQHITKPWSVLHWATISYTCICIQGLAHPANSKQSLPTTSTIGMKYQEKVKHFWQDISKLLVKSIISSPYTTKILIDMMTVLGDAWRKQHFTVHVVVNTNITSNVHVCNCNNHT